MESWKYPQHKIPVKSWCPNIEENAMEQIDHLAQLPFAYHHVAIMPDCHSGYGMPIGGVLATEGVVIPNAVGVDIGCGVIAAKSNLIYNEKIDKETLKSIMGKIRENIPVGFEHQKEEQDDRFLSEDIFKLAGPVCYREHKSALKQLGTLGGGNHFIEIQADEEDRIWIMIHSGSRNLGLKVAEHYNKIAKYLNSIWHTSIDPKWDLAFLPIETQEAKDYMSEMGLCVEFALANREHMMRAVQNIFNCGEFEPAINIAHNYAAWENHFGKNIIIHRKGATRARVGEVGIIPGSQGTHSRIVEGLGCVDSFTSCSHGAGRRMGRKDATRTLNLEEEIAKMDNQGIIHGIRNTSDLDEAAGAYKDIDEIMENQKDLVKTITKLRPLAVIKG